MGNPLVEAIIAGLEAKISELLGANERLHNVITEQIATIHELELRANVNSMP